MLSLKGQGGGQLLAKNMFINCSHRKRIESRLEASSEHVSESLNDDRRKYLLGQL